MTRITAFAAVMGLPLLLAMRWGAAPVAPWLSGRGVVSLTPTELCSAPVGMARCCSAQTAITAVDEDVTPAPKPDSVSSAECELPLGTTDGLRPGSVGESQRLHRRARRR